MQRLFREKLAGVCEARVVLSKKTAQYMHSFQLKEARLWSGVDGQAAFKGSSYALFASAGRDPSPPAQLQGIKCLRHEISRLRAAAGRCRVFVVDHNASRLLRHVARPEAPKRRRPPDACAH